MKIKTIIVSLCLIASTLLTAQDVSVIVNKENPVDTLSKKEVLDIFLGEKTMWDDGTKIVILILEEETTKNTFFKKYLKKNPMRFNLHWKKQVFKGSASMPKFIKTSEELINLINSEKGAIGFIAQTNDSVKTVTIE